MTKVFCDFCGEEIKPTDHTGYLRVRRNTFVTVKTMSPKDLVWMQNTLCEDCAKELSDWIKEKAKQNGQRKDY